MAIVQIETAKGTRHRDTATGKFASKSAFESQIQLPAVQKLIPAKSGIGPASPVASPISSLRDTLESISKSMTTLVELTRQSLQLQKGGGRNDLLGASDTGGFTPQPGKEDGGGQGADFEFPKPGPKMGLVLMLAGLALLFKFSDKLIKPLAAVLKGMKSIYINTLDFIDATKENLKGAITGPGGVIAALKIFKVDLTKTIKGSRLFKFMASGFGLLDVASGGPPGASKAGLLTRIMRIFKPLTDLGKTLAKMPVIKQIGTFFGKAGGFLKMLGKLFLPLTIIIAIYDSIMGALDGYKESDEETWIGKIIDGLAGGITGLINSLVGIPLDFLKSALGWVLGKMGFTGAEEALASFSFAEEIGKIIDSLFGYLKSAVKWIGTLFTDPVQALKDLWVGLVGEGGLLDILYAPIDAAIGWIMGIFGFDEPDTALTDEDGNFIGLKDLAINAVRWVWDKIKSFFKFGADKLGIDLPSFPSIKDMIFNTLGGLLPEPDKWYSRTLYKVFPDLKKVRDAFEAGGTIEGGKFVMPDTSAEINAIDPNTELAGATKENFDLKENDKGSTNVVTTVGGDTVKGGDTYNNGDLGQEHTDPTAQMANSVIFGPGTSRRSDSRLKENIKLVGKSPSNINIYEFKYKDLKGKYEGVMAQEVPWASIVGDDGYFSVDYSKLDVEFKKLN
jgi:hypothetical protein